MEMMHRLQRRRACFSCSNEKMHDRPERHLSSAIRAPQAISAFAILPKLDSAVLATSGVELPVRGVADTPDGTVMTFVDI